MNKTVTGQMCMGALCVMGAWVFYKLGLELWCLAYGMFM